MYSGQTRPTVEYDRQIKYLDYMENGQRIRGAGFVKLERRDGRCNISLQINGLYRRDHFTRPLILLSGEGERELCKLQLADGGIKTYIEGLDSHNMDGQGLDYAQLKGLRIPISEGKSIQCLWGADNLRAERVQDSASPSEQDAGEDMSGTDFMPEPVHVSESTFDMDVHADMPEKEFMSETDYMPESGLNKGERRDRPEPLFMPKLTLNDDGREKKHETAPTPPPTVFKEDKWEQLWAIYPHIRPFSDEREYLSLGPSDFVMLPTRYYKLVNNSFLLHGYYNYHHLILIRLNQKNDVRYYIGVPGNLYQKEKRIAVMFGFESFECAAEPASEGDFGYYLIPVEI